MIRMRPSARESRWNTFAAWKVLQRAREPQTFSEIVRQTGKANRVVSHQLRRLKEAGAVVEVEAAYVKRPKKPGRGRKKPDQRTKKLYMRADSWTWRPIHEDLLRQVAAEYDRQRSMANYSGLNTVPASNGTRVAYTLMLSRQTPKDEGYVDSPVRRKDIEMVRRRIAGILERDPGQWRYLLVATAADILASQPKCFYFVCAPAACLTPNGARWPVTGWQEVRQSTGVRRNKKSKGSRGSTRAKETVTKIKGRQEILPRRRIKRREAGRK